MNQASIFYTGWFVYVLVQFVNVSISIRKNRLKWRNADENYTFSSLWTNYNETYMDTYGNETFTGFFFVWAKLGTQDASSFDANSLFLRQQSAPWNK